jgi:hypothetical protein
MPLPIDISAVTKKFENLLQRYEEASASRGTDVRDLLARLQSGDEPEPGAFLKGMNEIDNGIRQRFDPQPELRVIMEELAPAYLVASAEERATIRKVVSERPKLADLIRQYAEMVADEVATPQDVDKLRRGLAAISIEDRRNDYRETLTALAKLFIHAEDAGIDPMPHFVQVAELSSNEDVPGRECVAEMLWNFDQKDVLGPRRRRKPRS